MPTTNDNGWRPVSEAPKNTPVLLLLPWTTQQEHGLHFYAQTAVVEKVWLGPGYYEYQFHTTGGMNEGEIIPAAQKGYGFWCPLPEVSPEVEQALKKQHAAWLGSK